jgi:septal ring factor EnvC (AmiA/AmiB activator)
MKKPGMKCETRAAVCARSRWKGLGAVVLALMLLSAPVAVALAESNVERLNREQLEDVRKRMEAAREHRARLARERAALERELEDLNGQLREIAARRQKTEAKIAETEARMRQLRKEALSLRQSLRHNRQGLAELMAALQRLRRDPPPPFVTRSDDALAAVRGALLLSAAVPALDARAQQLSARLERLRQVEAGLKQARAEMREQLKRLAAVRARMNDMLARKRELLGKLGQQLKEQEARIAALARRARTLNELMEAIRREERRRAELEAQRRRKAEEQKRKATEAENRDGIVKAQKPVPWPPARRFSSQKGRLPWPAQGRLIAGYGERLPVGGRSRGLYLSTLPRASVVAPATVRVQMAAPFRTYGQLLILDAGEGYTILLAGLARTSVLQGQVIRAGEPLGEMGLRPAPATLTGKRMEEGRPILYMELRKNGRPVDIGRWWRGARQEARRK